jgi:MFS family permease
MGLLPDGTSPQESSTDPASATGVSGRSATDQDVALSLRQVVRLPSFYLLLAAFALVFMAFPSLHLHMISFLTDRGLSAQLGVTVVAVMSATGALGALVFGLMAERYGSRLTMALVFLLMSAAFPLFLAVQSSVQALAWGVYYGFLGGGMFTLQQVIFADYFGRQSLGAVRGVVAPVQMGANAVGPLFAALAFDASGDYNVIFSAYGAFTLLASVFVFLARPPVRSAQPPPSDPAVGAVESSAT